MSRVSVSFDAFSNGFCVFYFFVFVFPTVSFLKLNRFSFWFPILVSFPPFVCPLFWHTRGFLFADIFKTIVLLLFILGKFFLTVSVQSFSVVSFTCS